MITRERYTIRPVNMDDARLLFDWRCRASVRRWMFDSTMPVWERHVSWLENKLNQPDVLMFIFEQEGNPLGHVNATRTKTEPAIWEWGFYIGARHTAPGSGSRMLLLMLEFLFSQAHAASIIGLTKQNNTASINTHLRLGFTRCANDQPEIARFELDRETWLFCRTELEARYFSEST